MTGWEGVLTNLTLGLPAAILVSATAAWLVWNHRDRPSSVLRATSRPLPDRDPVSRAYYAFESGRFSEVLGKALVRLDSFSHLRFGRLVRQLPRTTGGALRLSPSQPGRIRQIRRLRARTQRLLDISVRRELGIWLRLDFWRSRAELSRRFRIELATLLEDVGSVSRSGGSPA